MVRTGDIMQRIVFVAGIHGVGKSSMCARLAEAVGAAHLSSGALIRQSLMGTPESASEKPVGDVGKNQDALIAALSAQGAREIILDGHFVLLKAAGTFADVPLATFAELAPVGVLLILDEAEAIATRLWARDGTRYDQSLLEELQRRENAAACEVTRAIGAPLRILHPNDDIRAIAPLVRQWLSGAVQQ